MGLKQGDGVNVPDGGGEGVPEAWGGAAEGSSPHGGQASWRDGEVGGRGGSETSGGDVNLDEVGQVGGGQVMDCFESMEEDFVINTEFDGEPMELMEDGSDVTSGVFFCDNPGSSILD